MADRQVIEQDLREFLHKQPNIHSDDQIRYLMTIMDKHAEQDKLKHVISLRDLHDIVSIAKFASATVPHTLIISGKTVTGHDPVHISMIETVIAYLNKNSLLKRIAGFEYTR